MCELCNIPGCDCDPAQDQGSDAVTLQPVSAAGRPDADMAATGLLHGTAWNGPVVTFGFPDAAGFSTRTPYSNANEPVSYAPLSANGQEIIRTAFAAWDEVLALEFVESRDAFGGQINIGGSSVPSTAWAYYPAQGPSTNPVHGDIWISTEYAPLEAFFTNDSQVVGRYPYSTAIHEIGHALGLKHPHEASRHNPELLPLAYDGLEYTIMSYRSYVGGPVSGYTVEEWSYPQSPMILDIAAMQSLYGADYTTRAGDTVYAFTPDSGVMYIDGVAQPGPAGNRVFRTIWDGGGFDEIDLSAFDSDLDVRLTPGEAIDLDRNSVAQTAMLGMSGGSPVYAGANIYMALLHDGDRRSRIEAVTGGSGDDYLAGNGANNVLVGGAGNDRLNGRLGDDTLTLGSGKDTVRGTMAALDGDLVTDFNPLEDRVQVLDQQLKATEFWLNMAGQLVIAAGGETAKISLGLNAADYVIELALSGSHTFLNFLSNLAQPGDPDQKILGTRFDDDLMGGSGADTILLRFGQDSATGNEGADIFVLDGRYLWQGDAHAITDLDFAAGDQILLRGLSGGNRVLTNQAELDAFIAQEDVSAETLPQGLLLRFSNPDGGAFSLLLQGAAPAAIEPTRKLAGTRFDDDLVGGSGDDMILLRYGQDKAMGNGGADQFVLDGRYLEAGDAHEITDLDFAEGDQILLRSLSGLPPGSHKITTLSALEQMIANGDIAAQATDFGLELALQDQSGDHATLLLSGVELESFA